MKYIYIVLIWITSYKTVTHKCAGSSYQYWTDLGLQTRGGLDACNHTHEVKVFQSRDTTIYFMDRKEAFKCYGNGYSREGNNINMNRIDSNLISK